MKTTKQLQELISSQLDDIVSDSSLNNVEKSKAISRLVYAHKACSHVQLRGAQIAVTMKKQKTPNLKNINTALNIPSLKL